MLYTDTESIGFYGPTVLIQYAIDDGPIYLHNIWTMPVYSTLLVIEKIMEHKEGVCGYNLSHDSFHFNRTYNILKHLPVDKPPSVRDYRDVEEDYPCDEICVKPHSVLDLLVVGRKGEFQSTLKQKDIILRKVPKKLAAAIVRELKDRVKIPDIYFSKSKVGYRWRICELDKMDGTEITPEEYVQIRSGESEILIDPDFVNIRLSFNPSTALKIVYEHITGEKLKTIDEMRPLPKVEEYAWFPRYSGWMKVAREHIAAWTQDEDRLVYAKNDVEILRTVRQYFGNPVGGDDDSVLSWAVGSMFWHGFGVNIELAKERLSAVKKNVEACPINVNAPKQVLKYLHEVCTPLEKQAVPNTRKEVLKNLLDWKDDNPEVYRRTQLIMEARSAIEEVDLLEKLIAARRLYANFKVVGTKSNRMSGGNESYLSSRGSINPQGIKKGTLVRRIVCLSLPGFNQCGGDFDSFEVSIAEAEYCDPELRKDLLSGKKMHALFAMAMYPDLSYDEIMKNKDCSESHPLGYYNRGKRGFLGRLYGAQEGKLSTVMWLTEEEVQEGLNRFFSKYKVILESQEKIYEAHMALRQPGGRGSQVVWVEPKEYVESFLGFRRYFSMEYSVIKALYELANDMPEDITELGKRIKLTRTDRVQTGSGAACSSIYSAAFNIQSQIMRSAVNHKIQSPGGQITKDIQRRIWDVQPAGCTQWLVLPFNCHDEIQCLCKEEVVEPVREIVNTRVAFYRNQIPLINMEWQTGMSAWSDKK